MMTALTVALALIAVIVGWLIIGTLVACAWSLACTWVRRHRRPSRAQLTAQLARERRLVGDLATRASVLLADNERLAAEHAELRAYVDSCVRWLTADLRALPTRSQRGGDL